MKCASEEFYKTLFISSQIEVDYKRGHGAMETRLGLTTRGDFRNIKSAIRMIVQACGQLKDERCQISEGKAWKRCRAVAL